MNIEENKIESKRKKYLIFIITVFCFVTIPAMILFYSVYRYYATEEERLVFNLKINMQRLGSDLSKNVTAEQYFSGLFYEYYMLERNNLSCKASDTVEFCKKLRNYFGENLNFFIITKNGQVLWDTVPFKRSLNVWKDAYDYIRGATNGRSSWEGDLSKFEAVKRILGPLINPRAFRKFFGELSYSLYWADASGEIPPSAVYSFHWGGLFIYVSEGLLNSNLHLKYSISEYSAGNKVIGGLYCLNSDENFWCSSNDGDVEEIKNAFLHSEQLSGSYFETLNYHVCHNYLSKNLRTFAAVKKENTIYEIILKSFLAFLLYSALSWPIIKYGWNTIVLKIPGDASIRLKLAFLFLFACGIPLLTLGIIAREYNSNKRLALIEEARGWSVENLLGLEQRYSSFLKDICNDFDVYVEKWGKGLKNNALSIKYTKPLERFFKDYEVSDYFCVASEAKYLSSFEGLIRYTSSLDSSKVEEKNCDLNKPIKPHRYEELRIANIVMKKLCSDLNGTEISSYVLSKLEIVAESVIQKTFPEILSSVLETVGSIKEWGFEKNTNMTYFRFVSVYDPQKIDYIVVASWRPPEIQRIFVDKILPKANRNPKNFKFIAYDRSTKMFSPEIYNENPEIRSIANRARVKPTEELEIVNYKGEDYIAVSFIGRQLKQFCFVGLYPIRNIDSIIYEQSSLLWTLGLLCLALAAGLAQLLTKSFVTPLFVLEKAALAIEKKDFHHRLPTMGRDEFGEVGGIFSNVMVGLEELEIAKIVQESMFPKPNFAQGKFSIYGKTVTMIDVGGDYLDFFKVDDNSFSLLVGDVAGHGVGAAVIMAMAKATVLGADNLKSPAAILNQLHKVILAAKNSKQKKIMTFQYIHVNSETAEALYGNAGACSPWLVKHNKGTVEELRVPGAALGAFKRAVYKEIPLKFEDGDALIFYTDGIVECKNPAGEMLGYDNLKLLLQRCWDSDVEKYYNNIYNEYMAYIGAGSEAGDDLTIAILMYNDVKTENTVKEDAVTECVIAENTGNLS